MGLITSDIVEAYSLCLRKAFMLLRGEQMMAPHEYPQIIVQKEAEKRRAYQASMGEAARATSSCVTDDIEAGHDIILDALVVADGLEARYDVLKKSKAKAGNRGWSYEPVKVLGTRQITKAKVVGLAYLGHVLGQVQPRPPLTGTLIRPGGQARRVRLAGRYEEVRSIVATLKVWVGDPDAPAPAVVLNKHCPCCPFSDSCWQIAEKEDSLSLLDRMTPLLLQKYHRRGIFTVHQLSFLFKPRRSRRKKRPVRHSLELQALAIRTGKTYVEHVPELSRCDLELFVDVEGIPEQDLFYLIGFLECRGDQAKYYPFWANGVEDEMKMWEGLVERAVAFPEAPIYHYGSYERKAFQVLSTRYGRGRELARRLINVASSIYGKVYFPIRANSLKVLGGFLGATWTSPDASGLQSLVWRDRWEASREEHYREILLQYNREDCEALRLLVEQLVKIRENIDSEPAIDFAHRPKQNATELGSKIHRQFERILKYAEQGSERKQRPLRIRIEDPEGASDSKKRGAPKGHPGFHRIIPPKAGRIIRVPNKRRCPRHHTDLIPADERLAQKTVIDLIFTKSGCRKTITRYVAKKAYCPQCKIDYNPPCIDRLHRHLFGHGFQAWTVYQRIVLRLPYGIIKQVMGHLFGVGLSEATIVNFLYYLSNYYAATEKLFMKALLRSAFVHVDETRIKIQGIDHYVWVFTDGEHVVFRMTETRESKIVHEVLAGYEGVLVSDFYPGYDSVSCRKQKCWVHLIRDINDDLWKAPFDREFETFAVEAMALLVPILEAVDRYGLKTWHLKRFRKDVDRFYMRTIIGKIYASELAVKYQKRLLKYREELFTFLSLDGIPWNNNMAERAIRQLAVQRKISGSFFKRVALQYLLMLAISQTCRFQGKSFLKFLLSKEKDVDEFRRHRAIKYSASVGGADDRSIGSL
jgi:predicted RecB family nuclease